jgi:SAM-dependent methyltransferase
MEFWNSQEVYWSLLREEPRSKPGIRARAASFIPEGGRILDVACGRASNCIWLLDRGQYFGSDISCNGLRHVQRKGLHLACADAEALPFADRSFDAVLATYALEHSVNPVQMLREMVRVVRTGGRIVLLGPTWDFPFWYPNSVLSRAGSWFWRLRYTIKRLVAQTFAQIGGASPFLIIDDPDAFTRPFVYDSDAVYVVWSFEVIRQMRTWDCGLVHFETDDQLLGHNPWVRLAKRALKLLPAYRFAGSTALMVFERQTSRGPRHPTAVG